MELGERISYKDKVIRKLIVDYLYFNKYLTKNSLNKYKRRKILCNYFLDSLNIPGIQNLKEIQTNCVKELGLPNNNMFLFERFL